MNGAGTATYGKWKTDGIRRRGRVEGKDYVETKGKEEGKKVGRWAEEKGTKDR